MPLKVRSSRTCHRSPSSEIRSALARRPFFMSGPRISRAGRWPSYDDLCRRRVVAGSHLLGLLARLDCAGGLASMAFLGGSFTAAPTSIGDLDPLSVRLAPA